MRAFRGACMAKRWLRMIWALAVALSLCACAPAAQPTVMPSASPLATAAPAQPVILVLPSSNQQAMISVNRHYSSVVKSKGWNIDFYTVHQYEDSGADSYFKYVTAQLASGVTKADGYFVYASGDGQQQALDKCKSDGLLFDCVAAAPEVIPDYWVRWKDDIAAARYGLPLCGQLSNTSSHMVFSVSPQARPYAPQGIGGYHDIRVFTDRLEEAEPGRYVIVATIYSAMDLWIQEQGYFSLNTGDGVCVRLDDPDAKPVLLEDIPGFEEILLDFEALRSAGRIVGEEQAKGERLVAGTLEPVGSVLSLYRAQGQYRKEYYAYPLLTAQQYAGDLYLAAADGASWYADTELVIPARSRRAQEAMAFVQWLYASEENADCVIYGKLGVDYALHGERIELSAELQGSFDGSNDGTNWQGYNVFYAIATGHIPLNAPENAESLRTAWPRQTLAAPWLVRLYDPDILDDRVSGGLIGIAGVDRSIALNQMIISMVEGAAGKSVPVKDFLDMLRGDNNDRVLEAYTRLFETLRTTKAKE